MSDDAFDDNPALLKSAPSADCESEADALKYPIRGIEFAEERKDEEDFPREPLNADRKTPLVRVAMPIDAKDLKDLAQSVSLSTMSATTAKRSGFLVSGFSLKEYTQFIKKADHFLTLHVGKELIGFLLAYGSEHITDSEKEELNMHIKNNLCRDFVLLKQICISSNHRRKGYASILYKELYARILHFYEHEDSPRPIYTAIVQEPANPVSVKFHEKMKFHKVQDFTPKIDQRPRSIFMANNLARALDNMTTFGTRCEATPFYDARAAMDPHCVGIGVSIYSMMPPDQDGLFNANVRIVMKWRQPGVEKIYQRTDDGTARTSIKQEHHSNRTVIRLPRYDLNTENVEVEQSYAYIDKNDPLDVITWQQVLRGSFRGIVDNLAIFPADVQELRFAFRIWDNDPDDRCRYFRQLHYADNTPWQLGIKRTVESLSFSFLAPQVDIEECAVCRTSRYICKIEVLRNTPYYLRTVAFPIVLITSLSFTSNAIDDFGDQVGFNSSLLLTTVAYLFITKDVTPETSEVTLLDRITYGALLLSAMLMMLHYIAIDGSDEIKEKEIWLEIVLCGGTVFVQVCIVIFLYVRYKRMMSYSEKLGEMPKA